MPNLRPIEIILIVLVILLLFGAGRLPELARSVGESLKVFKHEVNDDGNDTSMAAKEPPALPRARTADFADHRSP